MVDAIATDKALDFLKKGAGTLSLVLAAIVSKTSHWTMDLSF